MNIPGKITLEDKFAVAQALEILAYKGQTQISIEKITDLKKLVETEEDPKIKAVIQKTMGV